MCFEVPALVPPGKDNAANDDDLGIMDIDDNETPGSSSVFSSKLLLCLQSFNSPQIIGPESADLEALNESLHDLLDGIQVLHI